MRGKMALGAWVFLAGLACASIVRADDDTKMAPRGNWFTRFFTGDKKEAETKKADAKKDTGPPLQELHARAKEDLLRRQLICLRLSEIAEETGDAELKRKADQLDQRAFEIYLQRTGSPTRSPITLPEDDEFTRPRPNAVNSSLGRPTSERPKAKEN